MKLSNDAVSRQSVMDMFPRWKFVSYEAYLSSVAEIENLPSVESKQKIGQWVNNKCDKCSAIRPSLFDNYCPNCGAKMEGK